MRSMPFPPTALVILVLLSAAAGVRATPAGAPKGVSAREYKILLKGGNFTNPLAGAQAFWKSVTAVAGELGLPVKEESFEPEADRFVLFIDTKDFLFRKRGYLLRRRQELPFGARSRKGHEKHELTLKFRNADIGAAGAADVTPGAGFEGETTLEEDVLVAAGALRSVFSHTTRLDLKDPPGSTLADFAKVFPALGRLGAPGPTRLDVVNGIRIRELRYKPGKLETGGVKAKFTLTIWFREDADAPMVAEFSFKCDAEESGSMDAMRAGREFERFARTLADRNAGWVLTGATKTALVYGNGNANDD